MTDTLALLRGRQVVIPLTNQSGGAVELGDVVMLDDTNDAAFDTNAEEGYTSSPIGIVIDDEIADTEEGRVLFGGFVEQINLDGAADRGDWIKSDGVAGQGTPVADKDNECFAWALEAGATPQCFVFSTALITAGELDAAPDDYAYVGFGTDDDLSAEVDLQDFILHNLIRNNPGQIPTDGSEPQWWDDVANATITDEDAAGEACSDKFERVFKVVTTADDVYGYQTLTFADEWALDAGATEVSLGVWVWCAAANTASVGIYGTNLGLQESSQHTGGSGWELLTVEAQTLDAADASIQVRLICDTGTAFFGKMSLVVGPKAVMLKPRGLRFVQTVAGQVSADPTGDVAWSDTDYTGHTDNLAVIVEGSLRIKEPDGSLGSWLAICHASALTAADSEVYMIRATVLDGFFDCAYAVMCDDQQNARYKIEEVDGDSDFRAYINLAGYWMWE